MVEPRGESPRVEDDPDRDLRSISVGGKWFTPAEYAARFAPRARLMSVHTLDTQLGVEIPLLPNEQVIGVDAWTDFNLGPSGPENIRLTLFIATVRDIDEPTDG